MTENDGWIFWVVVFFAVMAALFLAGCSDTMTLYPASNGGRPVAATASQMREIRQSQKARDASYRKHLDGIYQFSKANDES